MTGVPAPASAAGATTFLSAPPQAASESTVIAPPRARIRAGLRFDRRATDRPKGRELRMLIQLLLRVVFASSRNGRERFRVALRDRERREAGPRLDVHVWRVGELARALGRRIG